MDWREIENDREKYQAYLCSREWAEKREAVRQRADNKCERCGYLPMDACHHLTYERKYNETLEDLQAICKPCHAFTHGKDDFDPCNWRQWMRYLFYCKNNDLKPVPAPVVNGIEPLPMLYVEAAKLEAIKAIYERWEEIERTAYDFNGGLDSDLGQRVVEELERIPEAVEGMLGLDSGYAAWLRFRKPYIPNGLYAISLKLFGLTAANWQEWPNTDD